MTEPLALFAVCAPGLEAVVAAELQALGLRPAPPTAGGVAFSGGLPELYRANRELRAASRVLVRLGRFHAAEFWELHKKTARLPWERYLPTGAALALRATCHKSRLYHSDAVAERVARAIGERLGRPVMPHAVTEDAEALPGALVVIRLAHDDCTVSVDSSGELLHRRGYRLATAKAPLRETLAAGVVLASGWDKAAPLADPFCGSGTLVIEAALLAAGIAPGAQRRFAFMDWPGFQPSAWEAVAQPPAPAGPPPVLWASDRDAGAVQAARANAERAGVATQITFAEHALSAFTPPPGEGWIVTNPPYGLRVSEAGALRDLYARFGEVLRERCPGWRVAFLCPEARLAHATGLRLDPNQAPPLAHGGLRVRLWQGRVERRM